MVQFHPVRRSFSRCSEAVSRSVRDRETGGSNPLTSTTFMPHARESAAPSRRNPGGAPPMSTGFVVRAHGAAPFSTGNSSPRGDRGPTNRSRSVQSRRSLRLPPVAQQQSARLISEKPLVRIQPGGRRASSSTVERLPYQRDVEGANPSGPTIMVCVAIW